ncbi:ferredoxin [Embleya sp. NPDC005971]|uniref:ferredoxin n=1 Tax=Embleya sp. NPDC005971 TaxID=3156724 RepID=UPI003401FDFC
MPEPNAEPNAESDAESDADPESNAEQPPPARPRVDLSRCIASGICTATAPNHFTRSPDGKAQPHPDAPPWNTEAQDAASLCPMEAIHLPPRSGSHTPE